MDFIKENNISIKVDDAVRVFYDPETGKLAFRKDENAPFRFTRNNEDTLRMSYGDLGKIVKETAEYSIEITKEFDLLLIPLRRENAEQAENQKGNKKQTK